MYCSKIIFLLLSLYFSLSFAQENRLDFKAFGTSPETIPAELYDNLQNASTINERYLYLDEIAQLFLQSGNADSLIAYSEKLKRTVVYARPEDTLLIDFKFRALYYEGLGTQKMGLMDEAVSTFIEAIASPEITDNYRKIFQLELAQTYILKGQLDKAKIILDDIQILKQNQQLYLRSLYVKSNYYILEKNYEQAKSVIKKALSEPFIDNYTKTKLYLHFGLAQLEFKQNNFDTAATMSATVKQEALNNKFYDIYTEAALAEGLSYVLLKEYAISEMALSSTYVNALQWNRLELQQKIIKALVQLYNAKGDYQNAFNLMTQYQTVSKTIAEKENQRLVRDLEFKYETLQKEKEIDNLQEDQLVKQAEIERQKTIKYAFLIGFVIILIPVILLLIVYYQKLQTQSLLNSQKEAINKQEVKSLMQSQELSLAKNTILVQKKERDRIARELHDSIGGNLAGIKLTMNSLGDTHPDFKKILHQLDTTYEQVREISHSLIPKAFEDSNFTELVKNYIQNFNQDSKVNLSFSAYPSAIINDLDANLQVTLFNIIKELITNAFKHADASEIEMQLTFHSEEQSLEFIYEDDGSGFNVEQTNKGIGLKNLQSRVKAFNGTFSINSTVNRGTVITLSIPQN